MEQLPITLESGMLVQVFIDIRHPDSKPYYQIDGNNMYLKGPDSERALGMFNDLEESSKRYATQC
jgi:hypothetical protein